MGTTIDTTTTTRRSMMVLSSKVQGRIDIWEGLYSFDSPGDLTHRMAAELVGGSTGYSGIELELYPTTTAGIGLDVVVGPASKTLPPLWYECLEVSPLNLESVDFTPTMMSREGWGWSFEGKFIIPDSTPQWIRRLRGYFNPYQGTGWIKVFHKSVERSVDLWDVTSKVE